MAVADWRSAERYGALCELSPADLAWEFLRRNPLYQDDFARFAETGDARVWARWGLTFPADPALSSREQPIFWGPTVDARAVVLTVAPAVGPHTFSYAPQTWPGEFVERLAPDGLHALLRARDTDHRLWMPTPIAAGEPVAFVVPLGADAARASAAALRLWRHLTGSSGAAARQHDQRLRRSGQSLRAFDGRQAGGSYRAIAEQIFGAPRVAAESWRTSSLRDATIRLVRSGAALVRGDYRRLLRHKAEE